MITRIVVHRDNVKRNRDDRRSDLPTVVVKTFLEMEDREPIKEVLCESAQWNGFSRMVHDHYNPLEPENSTVWVELDHGVEPIIVKGYGSPW